MPDIYIAPPKEKKTKDKPLAKSGFLIKKFSALGLKPKNNHLTAFLPFPKKISFEDQKKEEKIILLLRRHWLANIPWLLMGTVIFIIPLLLFKFSFPDFIPHRYHLFVVVIWYLFAFGVMFEKFLCWFFNVGIISDERIIDIDFFSLAYQEISQARLDKIQDVTYKGGGLLKSIFHYGDVFIQTASEVQTIEFHSIPRPEIVVQIINKLINN